MANQLFQQYGNQGNNPITELMNQVKEIQKSFKGDPKEEVQKLLNSGQLSQSDFNKYAQMANKIMGFMK